MIVISGLGAGFLADHLEKARPGVGQGAALWDGRSG